MPKQNRWRQCRKCNRLVHFDKNLFPPCHADGRSHDFTGSLDFILDTSPPTGGGLNQMLRCNKCRTLVLFTGLVQHCTAGGGHDVVGSPAYDLPATPLVGGGRDQWLRCNKCRTLSFFAPPLPQCSEGGGNDFTGSPAFAPDFIPLDSHRLDIVENGLPVPPGQPSAYQIKNVSGQARTVSSGQLAISFADGQVMNITPESTTDKVVNVDVMIVRPFGSEIQVAQIALGGGGGNSSSDNATPANQHLELQPDGKIVVVNDGPPPL